jgi:hypothetical protein
LKLRALEFKRARLPTKFIISPHGGHTLTQRENIIESLAHVADLPLPEADESLQSYVTALPDDSGSSRASSFQSSRSRFPHNLTLTV